MAPFIFEWFNLLVRWVHVIAAIMWIGDSFLFMWLDSHLSTPTRAREGAVTGELWMCHSGGFYEVVKRKSLGKDELPPTLYWFKWESYTTWLSGFLLLIIVYHLDGAGLLIDPNVYPLTHLEALTISVFILPIAYGLYELLWLTPLKNDNRVFGAVGLALVMGLGYGLLHVFSARGAFLQVGATLGTIMAANVFFRIIPAQRHMLAATHAGAPVDTSYGARAKGRSIQNHYLTLPVLFCMLSNHFPSTYGSAFPALVLGLMFVLGIGLKFTMNRRMRTPPWAAAGTVFALIAVIGLTRPAPAYSLEAYEGKPPVKYATVEAIVQTRCTACHSHVPSNAMFARPPMGVMLDTTDGIREHADRMFVRAVATRTMPLSNMTGMTDDERALLGAWFAQGAKIPIDADRVPSTPEGTVDLAALSTPLPTLPPAHGQEAQVRADHYFKSVCAGCHGQGGAGNGTAAPGLSTKPRNFTDRAWQASVTDAHIRDTIVKGGAAVGKSALMPAQPPLAADPETLNDLVKLVRSFGKGK